MKRASELMPDGAAAITLTYLGAERVVPNYNVMGVAKAALETSVKYMANDFGPDGIRVNAISAGPMKTLAGSAIGSARHTYRYNQENAPLKRTPTLEDIGGSALYLLSGLSSGVTGEIHYVDCGYNLIGVPSRQVVESVTENP
jgi:enoyl-[acyl-carrier protein] reductase I